MILRVIVMEGPDDELVARDLPEFLHILEEIKDKVPMVTQHVNKLSEVVASPDSNTENGISLLEVKVHLLLSSLINLTQLMIMKIQCHSINSTPPVMRLVEIKTVLEKLQPLDQKLRYQVDKLIRTAQTGISGVHDDPLRFKANPANMVSKTGDDGNDQSDASDAEEMEKLYVPPRVVAMPYDGDEDDEVKENRRKKKMMKKMIVQELRDEYLDIPEEVNDVGSGLRSRKEAKEEKEREMFEEANFMRLPTKRRVQSSDRRGGAREVLDDLMDFGEFPSSSPSSGKRRKVSSSSAGRVKSKKRGSKSKGRRRH